jgi:hypothetical protein
MEETALLTDEIVALCAADGRPWPIASHRGTDRRGTVRGRNAGNGVIDGAAVGRRRCGQAG